jgi:hypothetical protein
MCLFLKNIFEIYLRFCFERLYDVEEAENFTMKVKNTLLKLFDYYMNIDENIEDVYSVVLRPRLFAGK